MMEQVSGNDQERRSREPELELPTLRQALEAVRARTDNLESQISDLREKLAAAHEEQTLLHRLIQLRGGRQTAHSEETGNLPSRVANHTGVISVKHPAVEGVVELLTEGGRPVHISELMRLLEQRGVEIPGSGRQANLISHLRRDERIVRPSRGMYGLAAWGLTEMSRTRGRHRQRRVKHRAITTQQISAVAEKALHEAGVPLHYRVIAEEVQKEVAGAAQLSPQTIAAELKRSPAVICQVRRGIYWLANHPLPRGLSIGDDKTPPSAGHFRRSRRRR